MKVICSDHNLVGFLLTTVLPSVVAPSYAVGLTDLRSAWHEIQTGR